MTGLPTAYVLREPPGIDDQHASFIAICDAIQSLTEQVMRRGQGAERLPDTDVAVEALLDRLDSYSRTHFAWEWTEMGRIYDALVGASNREAMAAHVDRHLAEHTAFTKYFDTFRHQHSQHIVSVMSAYVFSKHWLTTHIATVDRELSYWYRVAHGLPQPPVPA
jgi:hemerythrin